MKTNYKILFICILLVFLILSIHTYCFGINMNLPLNNTSGNETANDDVSDDSYLDDDYNNLDVDESDYQDDMNNEQQANTPTTPSVVTTTSSDSKALSIDNILAIILIAIGVVLILFAVAIFVRFK